MSYKVSFLDNQVCGVDDFNAILGDIVQEGVITNDFDKTSVYQMSKMNTVTKDKISQGVSAVETSLACSRGMKDGENGVYVAPGLGIFGSGARVKVTVSEFVSFGDSANGYVYAYHDVKNNQAGFMSSGDGFPAEVDKELYILPLCSVVDGVFADKRGYAKAKVKVNICDTYNSTQKKTMMTLGSAYHNSEIELIVGGKNINFLVFVQTSFPFDVYVVEEVEYGVFDIRKGGSSTKTNSVVLHSNLNYDTTISDFRRGSNGELLVRYRDFSSGTYEYIMFASCYEEVSE